MKTLVIKHENLPTRFPFFPTLTWILAMDRWDAPQWLWGVTGLLFVMAWFGAIYRHVMSDYVDILSKKQ